MIPAYNVHRRAAEKLYTLQNTKEGANQHNTLPLVDC
jgi:hypothetical protein